MRVAATFVRLHGVDLFAGVVVAAGLLGFGLARIPLPQAVETTYGDYTRLTAFHLLPLLLAPILGVVLTGAVPRLERQSARSLRAARGALLVGCTVIAVAALLPAGLAANVEGAVQITTENTLCVIGAVAIISGWLDRTWSWFPVVAIGAVGLVSADHSGVSAITVVDRLPDDLVVGLVVWLAGLGHYTVKGGRADWFH